MDGPQKNVLKWNNGRPLSYSPMLMSHTLTLWLSAKKPPAEASG